MQYIIIGIIIICIVILCICHPRVNSVITILVSVVGIYELYKSYTELVEMGVEIDAKRMVTIIFLVILIIVDCIRDLVVAGDYYERFDFDFGSIDKLFVVKSVSALLTIGLSRIVFLFIVEPILLCLVLSDVKKKLQSDEPLPHPSCYSKLKAKEYYYTKYMNQLEAKGDVVSNEKTVESESKISRKKLDDLYPKKWLDKIVDAVAGDEGAKKKRDVAEKKLDPYSLKNRCAYLETAVFRRYPQCLINAMSKKGSYSVRDIKIFDELQDLHLTIPIGTGSNMNTEWSEYFIIQALQPLVLEGIFDDDDFNDSDVFDNHVYHYRMSAESMPSIDADNDPRFALD